MLGCRARFKPKQSAFEVHTSISASEADIEGIYSEGIIREIIQTWELRPSEVK